MTLLLASCASKQAYSPQAVNEAEELYQAKHYAEAALAFSQQASGTTGTEQALLLLRSVIAYAKAEKLTQAIQLLHSIPINENELNQTSLARLARAHIALAE